MSSVFGRISAMSTHHRAALVEEFEKASRIALAEPVAVVGIGCRFPGNVSGPEDFWQFLLEGRDAITEVPGQRWDADAYYDSDPFAAGFATSRWGGFLPDVAGFDADFFGVSPREAEAMDPQQRVLLEVAWEALEHAGIPPDSLGGTATAVMMGVYYNEYQSMSAADTDRISAYSATGNAHSVTVGRLSYLLGLRGPSVAVDTACSSSLVAIHLACQSLRLRESDLALAGGVSLMLGPETHIALSSWGMFSPHGRCKPFDAGADGFVRGEGCGVVVLKRLGDAVRDGDPVLAVVRGSAVNQDGRSNGITAPNALSQQDVIGAALRAGDIGAGTVNYVEAHGTGTALGDPIEFEALAATYGQGEGPCALGSVKSNVGHLEAAAGVAGFIKAVLAVQRGHIPPNLHFSQWNSAIDAASTRLFVPTDNMPWPVSSGPRRVGVSSFGFGGTNAHVVLEQAGDVVGVSSGSGVCSVVVSGKSVARVRSWAGVLAQWMEGGGQQVSLAGVAHSVNHHRASHGCFASVCARDRVAAVAGLRAVASGSAAPGVVDCHVGRCGPGTVFVYSGQGSQWVGMGRQLLVDEPAFAAAVADLEPDFVAAAGFSLQDSLAGGVRLAGVERIQPVLVGVQLALTQLWRSYGVAPDAVIGHSMGEVSAAVAAGVLSAAEGLAVIATRSRLMSRLAGRGAMALVELGAEATEAVIADYPQVGVAVYASPRQTVIAGPPEAVDAVIAVVARADRLARRIEVDVASHHRIIDPVLAPLRAALADVSPRAARIPLLSTTTVEGDWTGRVGDADYWVANLRNPVRFTQAVAAAGPHHARFIEVSPHPLLTHAISETLTEHHHHAIPTLVRDTDDTVTFHTNLNAVHTTSPPPTDHPPEPHPTIPTTPWHHTHHWITPPTPQKVAAGHPLLGVGVTDPASGIRIWENSIGPDDLWLSEHSVDDVCVLPGAAYAEIALAAMTEAFDATKYTVRIRELILDRLMPLTAETTLVTTLSGDESRAHIEIGTRSDTSGWTRHATADVELTEVDGTDMTLPHDDANAIEMDPAHLYGRLRSAGQQHGPAFQGIVNLSVADTGVVRARIALPSSAKMGSRRLLLHPVMVDIALQTLGATTVAAELVAETSEPGCLLPTRLAGIEVYGDVAESVWAIGSLKRTGADRFVGQAFLLGADERVLLKVTEIDAVLLRLPGRGDPVTSRMFTLHCEPLDLEIAPEKEVGGVLLVGECPASDRLATILAETLSKRAGQCRSVPARETDALHAAITEKGSSWDAIVVMCPPRSIDASLTDEAQLDLARTRTLLIVEIVKAVAHMGARNSPRLWIVTRCAQAVAPGESVTLAQSQLRGLAKVLTFEHPELRTSLLDIDAEGEQSAAAVAAELLSDADQDEVVIRHGTRFVRRLVPVPATPDGALTAQERGVLVDLSGTGAFVVHKDRDTGEPKIIAAQRASPTTEEVEVRVAAAALRNFDPAKAFARMGVVTAVGDGVASVEVGQRVVAVGSGALGSHLTAHQDAIVPVPDAVPDSDAVVYASAYLTALASLREVGRLNSGESVLIHSSTDEVGLGAVVIAEMIGARIYVEDLRDPRVADKVLDLTDGAGVNVVLNSAGGEAIRTGMRAMAAGGRFVQVSDGLPVAETPLDIAALAPGGFFAVVDIDVAMKLDSRRYRLLVQKILAAGAAGEVTRPVLTDFPFARLSDALRPTAAGDRLGTSVIVLPTGGRVAAVAQRPAQLVNPDGGYIVVGGTGGLGFTFARWLTEQGAGMVVINGRSVPSDETSSAILELNRAGGRLHVVTGDIAEPPTARKLVDVVESAGYRLRGVIHSAADLSDQIVLNMSDERVGRVFAPKVEGGWWLHTATIGRDLDWWVAFSSAASLLGSPGQGSYAAANSWLDGLVAYRRARGLPAVGINWGPWAEVGRAQAFADLGFSMITVEQGLTAMKLVLEADRQCTGVFGLDARQWFQAFPAASGSSLFSSLRDTSVLGEPSDGWIKAELDALDGGARPSRLAALIADEIKAVLRSAEPIDQGTALASLGLDSLMGLELRNRLEARLAITLPAALVWAYPTINELAVAMCERLGYPPTTVASDREAALSDTDMALLSDVVAASELQAANGTAEP
jgi:phthiocerol/phenolphthiocerol synthesis type-I polyketide synthase C